MAANGSDGNMPTPADLESKRQQETQAKLGFDQILRYLALGMAPNAPRLPQQTIAYGSMFGGYPKGFTNATGTKGSLSFYTLRQISQRSPLIAAIVSKRLHQVTRYAAVCRKANRGEVGFRIKHEREGEKDFKVDEGFKALCKEVEQMILKPWRVFWEDNTILKEVEPSMASFLSRITDDLLICNRPVVELALDPLGIPRGFGAIDGANVIPTFAALRYMTSVDHDIPADFANSYGNYLKTMQYVSDKYFIDINERTAYIYLLDGRPVTAFREDELIVAPQFPVTDLRYAGYPSSLVERAIFVILAEIMAMTANSKYFEYGSMAETIVTIKGTAQDTHVQDLQSVMLSNMSGVPGMFRLPIIATPNGSEDIEVVQLKQNHKDMLFDVYIQKLTNLCCAIFSMDPSEINEAPRAGDNSGALNQANRTKSIEKAEESGLESILMHYKMHIFDPIIKRIDPNLSFEWDFGKTEMEQLALAKEYAPITTVNERRQMLGLDPIDEEAGGEVIDNQFIAQMKQQKQQEEQQKQMQAGAGGQTATPPGAGAPPPPADTEEGGEQGEEVADDDEDAQGLEGGTKKKTKGVKRESLKGVDRSELINVALQRHKSKSA